MESTWTILLQIFLKVTNVDFFVYKTTGFIHEADIDFIDRFSLQESNWYLVKVPEEDDRIYTNH